jgi:hypothetical protein
MLTNDDILLAAYASHAESQDAIDTSALQACGHQVNGPNT